MTATSAASSGSREERGEHVYFFVVLAGALLVNVGVWNAGVPWDDEVSLLMGGLKILRGGASTNLYQHGYAMLLSTVTSDPYVAHVVLRFIASVASPLGLYAVLRSFRGLRADAVVIACLVFAGSVVCTPHAQNAPSHLFCLALVLPALAFLLRRPSLLGILVFILSAIVAAQMRPEYEAPLLLVPLGGALLIRARRIAGIPKPSNTRGAKIATALVALALVVMVPIAITRPRPKGTDLNAYLLLGLGQCYAAFYHQRHPEEAFSPMTEYVPLMNKVFRYPRSFTQALANNPQEVAHYVAVNSIQNLAKLPRGELSSRNKLYSGLVLLMLSIGSALGCRDWIRSRRGPVTSTGMATGTLRFEILILLLFLSASSIAIVLLVPLQRYYLSWIPLLYLWLAWSIDRILTRSARLRTRGWLVQLSAVLVFCFPVFWGYRTDKEVLSTVRSAMAGLSHKPVFAGNFVLPLAVFALKDDVVAINVYDGLSVDGLKNRTYDAFVPEEGTALWAANQSFFRAFTDAPEAFGYHRLALPAPVPFSIYVSSR